MSDMYYTSKKTTISVFGGFLRKVEFFRRETVKVGYSWKVFWVIPVYTISNS